MRRGWTCVPMERAHRTAAVPRTLRLGTPRGRRQRGLGGSGRGALPGAMRGMQRTAHLPPRRGRGGGGGRRGWPPTARARCPGGRRGARASAAPAAARRRRGATRRRARWGWTPDAPRRSPAAAHRCSRPAGCPRPLPAPAAWRAAAAARPRRARRGGRAARPAAAPRGRRGAEARSPAAGGTAPRRVPAGPAPAPAHRCETARARQSPPPGSSSAAGRGQGSPAAPLRPGPSLRPGRRRPGGGRATCPLPWPARPRGAPRPVLRPRGWRPGSGAEERCAGPVRARSAGPRRAAAEDGPSGAAAWPVRPEPPLRGLCRLQLPATSQALPSERWHHARARPPAANAVPGSRHYANVPGRGGAGARWVWGGAFIEKKIGPAAPGLAGVRAGRHRPRVGGRTVLRAGGGEKPGPQVRGCGTHSR